MDTRLHIVDSLDKPNANTQPTQTHTPRTMYIVYVVLIFVVACIALGLFSFGYYKVSELAETSYGFKQTFFQTLSYILVILSATLPLGILAMVINAIRSWVKRNSIVSGLDLPLHVNTLESDMFTEKLIEGAVAATLARMQNSKYAGVSTVSEGNNYSRTSNETMNTTQQEMTPQQQAYSDEVAINSILDDLK